MAAISSTLHRVAGARFALAAFLNLGRDHLDFHGSEDAYFEAKASLFDGLRPDAISMAGAVNIQSLAARGAYTWTAQTILPSNTLPSHISMLTGYPPEEPSDDLPRTHQGIETCALLNVKQPRRHRPEAGHGERVEYVTEGS